MARRTQSIGRETEDRAQHYLIQQGLTPVTRNWRCKAGEIDLIMQNADTLVFVEVRMRRDSRFGGALASADRRKQQRLLRAAQLYLQQAGWKGPCRFDVLGMDAAGGMEWIPDAFGLG